MYLSRQKDPNILLLVFLYFFVLCTACILWLYTLIYRVVNYCILPLYLPPNWECRHHFVNGGRGMRQGRGEVYLYHLLCIVLEDMRLKMNYDCMPGPLWVSISNLILADIALVMPSLTQTLRHTHPLLVVFIVVNNWTGVSVWSMQI